MLLLNTTAFSYVGRCFLLCRVVLYLWDLSQQTQTKVFPFMPIKVESTDPVPSIMGSPPWFAPPINVKTVTSVCLSMARIKILNSVELGAEFCNPKAKNLWVTESTVPLDTINHLVIHLIIPASTPEFSCMS